MPIRMVMTTPIQKLLKLPAVRPDSTLSDAPPSRDAVTTSATCPEVVEVNTLISSGMMAPARVPQLMMAESFHHSVPSPRSAMSRFETTNVSPSEASEVIQTSQVSGASKFTFVAFANTFF
jgi:hypothetical protein